jgi:hypothetical protein
VGRGRCILSNALFITAIFPATPYAFNYDMVVFGFNRTDNEPLDYWLLLAVWTVPFLTVPIGMASVPASCLPIAALGGRLLWRLCKTSEVPATAGNTDRGIEPVPLAIG